MQCLEDKDIRVCKKKVFAQDEQQWVDASFYRFTFTAHEEKERREMIEWCKKYFGRGNSYGRWYCAGSYLLMDEKTYMFYILCNS